MSYRWVWLFLGLAVVAFLFGVGDIAGAGSVAIPAGFVLALIAIMMFAYVVFNDRRSQT